jgi:hypothetical protein
MRADQKEMIDNLKLQISKLKKGSFHESSAQTKSKKKIAKK